MTLRALDVLAAAEVVVGYKTYLELIPDLLAEKEVFSSAMMKEIERCNQAVDLALAGKKVAVVSSGDPGVYGMAGLVFEILEQRHRTDVHVEIVPGVTSATAAAASLGAPLMHDFAIISLSDLLTPWDLIQKRVELAAQGDFVIALYNPKSKKRVNQIETVKDILLKHRAAETPVGIVRNAKRGMEDVVVSDLESFTKLEIDMFSLVIIGNSNTQVMNGRLVTPRGYRL